MSAFAHARASRRQPRCVCGHSGSRKCANQFIFAIGVFTRLLEWRFLGLGAGLWVACGLLAACVGICARASFPAAAEVRLWALREQHMYKQDNLCVWGVCKAAVVGLSWAVARVCARRAGFWRFVSAFARASFPAAAEVRLWAFREQHMYKQDNLCVWGVCKAAVVGLSWAVARVCARCAGFCRLVLAFSHARASQRQPTSG